MQIPYISPIEDFSDLLNILGSETKFGQRLTAINDAQELLNKSLDRHKDISDIENTRQQAAGHLADAKDVMRQADAYADGKKKEGDDYHAARVAEVEKKLADLAAKTKAVEVREAQVGTLAAAVEAESKNAAKDKAEAATEKAESARERQEALRLQAVYQAKLKAIEKAAGIDVSAEA